MFRKILLISMLTALWAAGPALAENNRPPARDQYPPAGNPAYQQPGAQPRCYTWLNGQGKVITWAKTKQQCEHQTNGQSWGHSGHYENFYRDWISR